MIIHKYSFILLLILPPVLILGFAVMLAYIPLPPPLPQPGSHSRNLTAAILTGILGLVWVIAMTVFVVNSFLSSGRKLESAFTSRGLKAGNYQVLGRQYQGSIDGHQVEAQFTPGRLLQNGLLNIRIETTLSQRMAIGVNKPLLDCSDCEKVNGSPYSLGSIQVFAENPTWAQGFLGETSNAELINRLMDNSEGLGFRELYMQSGWIWLHARPSPTFDATHLNIWLQILLDLSSVTENMN